MMKQKAFTLIELLIVVAIIAILAAIAVPNFLEAQVRSKVSRAKADMRSIATGIESYYSDYNKYPPNPDVTQSFNITPYQITTPIAYITSRPRDPFKEGKDVTQQNNPSLIDERFYYDYYTIIPFQKWAQLPSSQQNITAISIDAGNFPAGANVAALKKYGGWLQWSAGPDGLLWNKADDFAGGGNLNALNPPNPLYRPWGYSFDVPYDPTNGSVSFGNIIRSQRVPDGLEPFMP